MLRLNEQPDTCAKTSNWVVDCVSDMGLLAIKPMTSLLAALLLANLSLAGCDNSCLEINAGGEGKRLIRLYSDDRAAALALHFVKLQDHNGCTRPTDCRRDRISATGSMSEHLTSAFVWHLR